MRVIYRLAYLLVGLVLVLGACTDDPASDTTAESSVPTSDAPATTAGSEGGSEAAAADTTPESGEGNQVIRVVNPEEPPSLDMTTQAGAVLAQVLLYNTMEPLVQIDDNGEPQPLLAESWEVSDDGLTYTFNLRQGVTFHDGSPLTAEDVVFTFEYGRDFEGHVNGADFSNVNTVNALDDSTVAVTLNTPDSMFLSTMALHSGVIVAERHLADMPAHPIGTGPFAFSEWNRGESLFMERYDGYWGDTPALDGAVWTFINDENAAINALLAGDVDAIGEVNAFSRAQELEANDDIVVVEAAGDNISQIAINHADAPFDNLRVRQALAHAIDEQAILDAWGGGYGATTSVFASMQEPWWDDYDPYEYDPELARQILQEEGLENVDVEVAAINDGISLPQAEIIMAQMFEAGFNPELVTYDLATGLETITQQANYQISPIGVKGIRILRMTCDGGWWMNYCDEDYDALIAEALTATSQEAVNDTFREAVHLLADDVANVPFIARVTVGAHRSTVSGWRGANPDGVVDLRPLAMTP